MKRILLPVFSVFFLFLLSCSSSRSVCKVYSTIPEMLILTEEMNQIQSRFHYEFVLVNDLLSLKTDVKKMDLVIASGINDPAIISSFRNLGSVFSSKLKKEHFISGILATGQASHSQVLLPVSFHVPIILTHSDQDFNLGQTIRLEDLMPFTQKKSSYGSGRIRRLSFSPFWGNISPAGKDLIPTMKFLSLLGSKLKATSKGLTWDSEGLRTGLKFLQSWYSDGSYSVAECRSFSEIYLYEPTAVLVQEKTIDFALSSLSAFCALNPSVQNDLKFHFPANSEGKITADGIVFAGIPKNSKNIIGAETALKWLFQTDNQKKLIALYKNLHIDQFGLAGGFPSLKTTNESYILDYQPSLSGSFPAPDSFIYETAKPLNWENMVEEVFYPWLINPASVNDSGDADLKNRLVDWYKQTD